MTRMPRGQCRLPADDAGRILDRLAGLEQIIRPDDIRQALTATGRVSKRSCVLTYEIILWVVLAMGLLTDLPIRQVFKHARKLRVGEKSPKRSNLCMARQRLGVAPNVSKRIDCQAASRCFCSKAFCSSVRVWRTGGPGGTCGLRRGHSRLAFGLLWRRRSARQPRRRFE